MNVKHTPDINCATHLAAVLTPRRLHWTVANVVKFLKKKEFDAVAFRGLSGSLIAPIVAMHMGKTLLAVRKIKGRHSNYMVEGDYGAKTYIILDDFISTGSTIYAIMKEIHKEMKFSNCVGFLGYIGAEDGVTELNWYEGYDLDRYCVIHGTLSECGRSEAFKAFKALVDVSPRDIDAKLKCVRPSRLDIGKSMRRVL